jgi:hypothetical protein
VRFGSGTAGPVRLREARARNKKNVLAWLSQTIFVFRDWITGCDTLGRGKISVARNERAWAIAHLLHACEVLLDRRDRGGHRALAHQAAVAAHAAPERRDRLRLHGQRR